jgi:PAS domain S-box
MGVLGEPRGGGVVERTRAIVAAVVGIFLALYWASLVQDMRQNEDDARAAALRHADFSASAAAEAVAAMLDRFRVSLRIAATAALQGPEAMARYGEEIGAGADDMVLHLFYVEAGGTLTYTSLGASPRVDVADRDYFQALAGGGDFVVGVPVRGRLSGQWSIQVAHAVRAGDRFAGVVAMAVSPRRWVEHLARFQAGPNDMVALLSPDGVFLLRTHDGQQAMGQRLQADRPFLHAGGGAAGSYAAKDSHDGADRIFSWRRLASGHVVVSGVALEDAMAPARRSNRQILLRGVLATAALLGALALVAVFIRRSDRVARGVAEQEYLRRVTLSVMAEGLAVVHPDGSIAFHNDSFARLVPYNGDRLRRLGSFERWEVIDAEGRPLPLERFPSVVTARTGQAFDNLTLGVGIPDGGVHWLNINTRPLLGDDGKPYAAILTMTDITSQRAAEKALKHSEERYRALVDSLMEGILVQNAEGTVVAANPAAERILGMSHDQMMGRTPADPQWRAIHPDGTPFTPEERPTAVTLRTGRRQEGVVMGLTRPDGTDIWIEVNTAPLWTAGGDGPSSVVSSLLDITNRKAFEDELSRSNAELEQFAYAVSHDLREPLRMVASYVQLLQRRLGEQLTDEIREFIGYAADGAKRMDRMLVALLEYSRVGRVGQPMDWMDSRQSLEEALLFLSPAIRQTGAEIVIAGEWPEILASPDEIERLFQNLLGNALKYHGDGAAPVVRIEAARDGAAWRFSFTDNGIGIAPDQVGRLFKVFQRLHANDHFEGSGVGLALCRKIVQRYDGRIWVESGGLDLGSSFVFTLPLGMTRRRVQGKSGAEAMVS